MARVIWPVGISRILTLSDASRYPLAPDLNLRIPAAVDERRQPPDFQLAADDDEQIGSIAAEDEARLRLDEVRILIALGDRIDGTCDRRPLPAQSTQIFGRRDHVQLAFALTARSDPIGDQASRTLKTKARITS